MYELSKTHMNRNSRTLRATNGLIRNVKITIYPPSSPGPGHGARTNGWEGTAFDGASVSTEPE